MRILTEEQKIKWVQHYMMMKKRYERHELIREH